MQRTQINDDAVTPQILPMWYSDRTGLYLRPLQYTVIRWTCRESVLVMTGRHSPRQARQVIIDVDRSLHLLCLHMDEQHHPGAEWYGSHVTSRSTICAEEAPDKQRGSR